MKSLENISSARPYENWPNTNGFVVTYPLTSRIRPDCCSGTASPTCVKQRYLASAVYSVRDTLAYFRGRFIDCSNADQAATRVYPHAILRISSAHHPFALYRIELNEDLIEVMRCDAAG